MGYGGRFEEDAVSYGGLSILELEGCKIRRFMSSYFDTRRLPDQLVD